MALAVDATSSIAAQSATDPWTWSHTCSGSDRILVVAISSYTGGTSISGVTYGGTAMTAGATATNGTNFNAAIYYLINPATGANNISVDFSGVRYGRAAGISFTGAHQSSQPDAIGQEQATHISTNVLDITTLTADTFIVDAISLDTTFTSALTVNGAQTALFNDAPSFVRVGASYKSNAGAAGAKTMTWTWSSGFAAAYAHAGIAIKPSVTAAFIPPKNPAINQAVNRAASY